MVDLAFSSVRIILLVAIFLISSTHMTEAKNTLLARGPNLSKQWRVQPKKAFKQSKTLSVPFVEGIRFAELSETGRVIDYSLPMDHAPSRTVFIDATLSPLFTFFVSTLENTPGSPEHVRFDLMRQGKVIFSNKVKARSALPMAKTVNGAAMYSPRDSATKIVDDKLKLKALGSKRMILYKRRRPTLRLPGMYFRPLSRSTRFNKAHALWFRDHDEEEEAPVIDEEQVPQPIPGAQNACWEFSVKNATYEYNVKQWNCNSTNLYSANDDLMVHPAFLELIMPIISPILKIIGDQIGGGGLPFPLPGLPGMPGGGFPFPLPGLPGAPGGGFPFPIPGLPGAPGGGFPFPIPGLPGGGNFLDMLPKLFKDLLPLLPPPFNKICFP